MWLQVSQIKKKKRRKRKMLIFPLDVTKMRKTRLVSCVLVPHLGALSCDAMCRMLESKSNFELFNGLFIELFCHIFWS